MTTLLARTDIAQGLIDEYQAFASLVASLDPAEWATPSRCAGFEVRDVAGHVIGLAEDVVKGVPGSRNAEEEAASVRGDTPARQRHVCARSSQRWNRCSPRSTTRCGTARVACPTSRSAPASTCCGTTRSCTPTTFVPRSGDRRSSDPASAPASTISPANWSRAGWGPATLALSGQARRDIAGGGREVNGDPLQFVLAATGRLDPSTLDLGADVNIYAT